MAASTCLECVIAALGEEKQALAQSRFDELPAFAHRKNVLLQRLAGAEQAREEALRQAGLAGGRAGMEAAGASSGVLADAWRGVLERAARARRLNVEVAAIVYTNLEFTRNALAFLQSRSDLYGRDGARQFGGRGGNLALG